MTHNPIPKLPHSFSSGFASIRNFITITIADQALFVDIFDVCVENLQQGFTHCFVVSFLSEADRAEYLPHPAHKEFGQIFGPHLDKSSGSRLLDKN